ncbi:hypothetical protein BS47DRAFT_89552 [Hydnum rufescens UP504]|uniref:Uncharacterized protein n=1 Tax=Hydnum rufescens UP504 TaxID=1448309 RepID=A0A9P6ARX3_9AGAM|nr:hypothetical protein BS47DRAFT_89552 [Hydnum rufescens UP504]
MRNSAVVVLTSRRTRASWSKWRPCYLVIFTLISCLCSRWMARSFYVSSFTRRNVEAQDPVFGVPSSVMYLLDYDHNSSMDPLFTVYSQNVGTNRESRYSVLQSNHTSSLSERRELDSILGRRILDRGPLTGQSYCLSLHYCSEIRVLCAHPRPG